MIKSSLPQILETIAVETRALETIAVETRAVDANAVEIIAVDTSAQEANALGKIAQQTQARDKLRPVDEQEVQFRLFIAADLPYFKGHFPEQAVLPGVTQLDWAIRLGCEYFNYPLKVASLEVLKFQQLMLPNTYATLTIKHNKAKAKLIFTYTDGDKRFASGRIALDSGDNSGGLPCV